MQICAAHKLLNFLSENQSFAFWALPKIFMANEIQDPKVPKRNVR